MLVTKKEPTSEVLQKDIDESGVYTLHEEDFERVENPVQAHKKLVTNQVYQPVEKVLKRLVSFVSVQIFNSSGLCLNLGMA